MWPEASIRMTLTAWSDQACTSNPRLWPGLSSVPFAGNESSGSEALVRPPVTKKTLFTMRVSLLVFFR